MTKPPKKLKAGDTICGMKVVDFNGTLLAVDPQQDFVLPKGEATFEKASEQTLRQWRENGLRMAAYINGFPERP